jgi:hypothetical protein
MIPLINMSVASQRASITAKQAVVSSPVCLVNPNLCMSRKSKSEPIQCPNRHRAGSRFCGKHSNTILLVDGSRRSQKTSPVQSAKSSSAEIQPMPAPDPPIRNLGSSEKTTGFTPITHLDYFRDPGCNKLSSADVTRNYRHYKLDSYRSTPMEPSSRRSGLSGFIRCLANCVLHEDMITRLQRVIRCRRVRILAYNRGLAALDQLKLCNNTEDFFSFDQLSEINPRYLFTYKDVDGFHYGFHIHSFIELINRGSENPYNRAQIPQSVSGRARRYMQILSTWERLDNKIVPNAVAAGVNLLQQKQGTCKLPMKALAKLKLTNVFQKIDFLGYQTDMDWLYDKSALVLNNFIKALYRTWTFQLGITEDMKQRILPDQTEFDSITDEAYRGSLLKLNKHRILTRILDILDKMLHPSIDQDTQHIVAIMIIHSLYYIEPRRVFISNPWLD